VDKIAEKWLRNGLNRSVLLKNRPVKKIAEKEHVQKDIFVESISPILKRTVLVEKLID